MRHFSLEWYFEQCFSAIQPSLPFATDVDTKKLNRNGRPCGLHQCPVSALALHHVARQRQSYWKLIVLTVDSVWGVTTVAKVFCYLRCLTFEASTLRKQNNTGFHKFYWKKNVPNARTQEQLAFRRILKPKWQKGRSRAPKARAKKMAFFGWFFMQNTQKVRILGLVGNCSQTLGDPPSDVRLLRTCAGVIVRLAGGTPPVMFS